MNPEQKLPRSSFLKLLGITAATIAVNSIGINPEKISIGEELETSKLVKEQSDEIGEMLSEETSTLNEIKDKFNIDVHHTAPVNNQNEASYPQETEDLKIVLNTLKLLPTMAFTGNHMRDIFLYKTDKQNSYNGVLFSGYDNRKIDIILSTEYQRDKLNTNIQFEYYRTQGRFFSALIIHEFGHLITENYQDMYQAWIKHNKWSQNSDGKWVNHYPEQISQEAEAQLYPWEDFSASLSLMTLNTPYFKKLSPSRYYFFQNNPVFSDWSIFR